MSNIYPSPHGKHFELSNLVPPKNIYSQTSTPGQIVAEQANHCFQWMLSVIQEVSDQGLTQHYHHQESPDLILADRPSFSHVIIRSNQINLSLCLKTKSETWKRKRNRKCTISNRNVAHFGSKDITKQFHNEVMLFLDIILSTYQSCMLNTYRKSSVWSKKFKVYWRRLNSKRWSLTMKFKWLRFDVKWNGTVQNQVWTNRECGDRNINQSYLIQGETTLLNNVKKIIVIIAFEMLTRIQSHGHLK